MWEWHSGWSYIASRVFQIVSIRAYCEKHGVSGVKGVLESDYGSQRELSSLATCSACEALPCGVKGFGVRDLELGQLLSFSKSVSLS